MFCQVASISEYRPSLVIWYDCMWIDHFNIWHLADRTVLKIRGNNGNIKGSRSIMFRRPSTVNLCWETLWAMIRPCHAKTVSVTSLGIIVETVVLSNIYIPILPMASFRVRIDMEHLGSILSVNPVYTSSNSRKRCKHLSQHRPTFCRHWQADVEPTCKKVFVNYAPCVLI